MSKEIILNFNDWSKRRIRKGAKRATTRREKHGEVGDRFDACGRTWELTDVIKVDMVVVKERLWKVEGCRSPGEFVRIWNDCYPRTPYKPDRQVWLHKFKEIPKEQLIKEAAKKLSPEVKV